MFPTLSFTMAAYLSKGRILYLPDPLTANANLAAHFAK
jgi:hypothetical protein